MFKVSQDFRNLAGRRFTWSAPAPAAIELYATAFDQAGALDKLEGFASHFGADFYGLLCNSRTLTLRRESWRMPETLAYAGDDCIVPLMAGESIPWKLVQD